MAPSMQDLEQVEEQIALINEKFRLLSEQNGGKLTPSQVELRDDMIAELLQERDRISSEIKAKIV